MIAATVFQIVLKIIVIIIITINDIITTFLTMIAIIVIIAVIIFVGWHENIKFFVYSYIMSFQRLLSPLSSTCHICAKIEKSCKKHALHKLFLLINGLSLWINKLSFVSRSRWSDSIPNIVKSFHTILYLNGWWS